MGEGKNPMQILFYTIMGILFALVTLFGLGPVMLADGTTSERILTLLIVLAVYFLLGWIVVFVRKRSRNSNN